MAARTEGLRAERDTHVRPAPGRRGGGARLVAAIALFAVASSLSSARGATTASPPTDIANYTIAARLDPEAKTIVGEERIHWRNTATTPATDLWFHLYLNAFANNRTTFLRESKQLAGRDVGLLAEDGWGWIDLASVRIGGEEMASSLQVVQPDDANPDDRTVVRLPLPRPVPPGGSVDIDIDFNARLPRLYSRTGYAGRFFFVAQWFPKLGVFANGAWNCHQYHSTTEYFADFGTYDVRLTLPREFVVGATGERVEDTDNGDGTRTLRYRAERVHDFAWTADPRFQVVQQQFGDIELQVLCHPRDCSSADRHLEGAKQALRWFGDRIGAYPYRVLTLVDPGRFGEAAGGMEYPTLVTTASARWVPRGLRIPEWVAAHEVGHQFWYGIVANNEFEEAWLDEGLNSYTEIKVLREAYGPGMALDFMGLRADASALHRARFMLVGSREPVMWPAWRFLDDKSYDAITYSKTALALTTLESYVGEERLLGALHAYYDRWRYRHPTGEDFVASLETSLNEDLHWFVDPVLRGSGTVDFAVTALDVAPLEPFAGRDVVVGARADTGRFQSTVVVERLGDVQVPVDITVSFGDGTEVRERWDGRERWRRLEYSGTQHVAHAVVDIDDRVLLDSDPVNNSRMAIGATRGLVRVGLRWGFWFQSLLQFLTAI